MEYQINTTSKKGCEKFIGFDKTLLNYWQWAHSDIASNAERGKLAEFIVKCAVNSPSEYRIEWDSVDVVTQSGIKIEVKSSAYLQSWKCNNLSRIQFDIAPKLSWDSLSNKYFDKIGRYSDVYVCCLFACQNPTIANPMDMSQWEFYVIPTTTLNAHNLTQKSISLNTLIKIGAQKVTYSNILKAVELAYKNNKDELK